MNKIIIDADPGVDDTFAILLAAKSPLIELLGITVVSGNCGLENAVKNTFKILDMCDKNYIPVYRGSEVPLEIDPVAADYVHGKNGFGNLEYDPIIRSTSGDAVEYLIKTVNENPGEITLVAIGPLTNVALAIMRDNDFAKNLKRLILMGSAKVQGNISKYAEFNIFQDPEAAKTVFDSEIEDVTVFGVNVTHKLPLKKEYEDYLKNSDNELANTLYKITRCGAEYDKDLGGLALHDPLTIAYLIDSNVVKLMKANVEVETNGEMAGKTHIALKEDGRHKVAYEVDPELFYEILFETLFEEKI